MSTRAGYLYLWSIDVLTTAPAPTVHSTTPPSGTVGVADTLTIVGFGLGRTQAEFHAEVRLILDGVPTVVPVTTWTAVNADADAYTAARTVDGATVDPEHTVITVAGLPAGRDPVTMSVEVVTDGGTVSCGGAYTLAGVGTVSSGGLGGDDAGTGGGRLGPRRAITPLLTASSRLELGPPPFGLAASDMPQRRAALTLPRYAVVEGKVVGAPALAAVSHGTAWLSAFDISESIDAAADLGDLGATGRWLPDPATLITRHDVASDMNGWHPSFGSAPDWLAHDASLPYIDPTYGYWARRGHARTRAAMVFDGTTWAQQSLGSVDGFTFIMVATLRHDPNSVWFDLLASPSTATDPLHATDVTLRARRGKVAAYAGGRLADQRLHPPLYRGRKRPVIIVWGMAKNAAGSAGIHGVRAKSGLLGVVDVHRHHYRSFHHSIAGNYDGNVYLAVNGGTVTTSYTARIDVLDLSYYDHLLPVDAAMRKVNRLDGVYGVHGK